LGDGNLLTSRFCLQGADGADLRSAVFHPADRVMNQGVVALQVQLPFDAPAVTVLPAL
jgi:hypothetical protein